MINEKTLLYNEEVWEETQKHLEKEENDPINKIKRAYGYVEEVLYKRSLYKAGVDAFCEEILNKFIEQVRGGQKKFKVKIESLCAGNHKEKEYINSLIMQVMQERLPSYDIQIEEEVLVEDDFDGRKTRSFVTISAERKGNIHTVEQNIPNITIEKFDDQIANTVADCIFDLLIIALMTHEERKRNKYDYFCFDLRRGGIWVNYDSYVRLNSEVYIYPKIVEMQLFSNINEKVFELFKEKLQKRLSKQYHGAYWIAGNAFKPTFICGSKFEEVSYNVEDGKHSIRIVWIQEDEE